MKTSIKLFFTVALTLLLFGSCVNDDVPNGGKSAQDAKTLLTMQVQSDYESIHKDKAY